MENLKYEISQLHKQSHMPSITPTYSDTPPSATNKISNPTAEYAVKNVTEFERIKELYDQVEYRHNAVEKSLALLGDDELRFIEMKYFKGVQSIYKIADTLHTSKDNAYKIHQRALHKCTSLKQLSVLEWV
jgi:hypothetical protein